MANSMRLNMTNRPCYFLLPFAFLFPILLYLFSSSSSFNPTFTSMHHRLPPPPPPEVAPLPPVPASVPAPGPEVAPAPAPTYDGDAQAHNTTSTTISEEKRKIKKIEGELARARAAIRMAAMNKNYTTTSFGNKQITFIPSGPLYRNPFAFYQSHIEMMKRFKVWTYKEGDPPLIHQSSVSSIYGIDGQFMEEMETGTLGQFRASHPDQAHVFFLPYSVAKMVWFLYRPLVSYNRGPLFRVTLDYVNVVAKKYPYWNRSSGADHFMLSCHDWAPEVSHANRKLLQNLIRAVCNANISEGFRPQIDVPIPEVNIPAGQLGPPHYGVRPSRRHIFAFFAGRAHGHVRASLFEHWKEKDNEIQVHEKLARGQNYYKLLGQSKFCLCPSGYEVASPRIVEAIHAECVPVIIKDNYSLPFSDVLNWSEFSIYIPVARIPEIKMILKEISLRRYLYLKKGVKSIRWHFTLNRPSQPFDLIHMVLHSIWLRRLNIRLPYS